MVIYGQDITSEILNGFRRLQIFSLFGASTPPWSAEVAPTHELNYGGFYQMNIRNEIKAQIIRAGMTMQGSC